MLALFYLASISLGGISLVPWLGLDASGRSERPRLGSGNSERRLVIGVVLGQVGGVWALYIISTMMGSLSYLAIFLTGLLFLLPFIASFLLPPISKKTLPGRWHDFFLPRNYSAEFMVLLSILAIFFIWLNLHAILPADDLGNLYATEHVWADTPFHVSLINSFAERDNFPPAYPILEGAPLRYPFLVDLHTAALAKGGMSLRQGIVVSNIMLQIPIFLLIYLVARELGGSRRTGFLASLIFLLLGNFGFLLAFKDISKSGGFFPWLSHLPWGYTGSSLGVETRESIGVGLYLGNPTYLFFVPRRAVTFGVAVSLTLMLILLKLAQNRGKGNSHEGLQTLPHSNKETQHVNDRESYLPFMAAGLLLGLLPRIHSHSFIVMTIFTGFLLISGIWWHSREQEKGNAGETADSKQQTAWALRAVPFRQNTASKIFWWDFYVKAALLLVIALTVAMPQLLSLREQVSNNFFKFWPGWIGEAHEAFTGLVNPGLNIEWASRLTGAAAVFLKFWVWNAGLLLILLPFALWKATRNQLLFYCPFILLFILGNLVKIQPWEWDNNNLFLYWQLGTLLIVTLWLGRLCARNRTVGAVCEPRPQSASLKVLRYGLLYFLIAILMVGGVINIIRTSQERILLWGEPELKMAQWVRENTSPGSLFLTGSAHNHPIPSLGGRQIVMGFEGWLFSHGLAYDSVFQDEIKMFQGDMPLLVKYGIDYVALTPYERDFSSARSFRLNESFFRNPELFEPVYGQDSPQGRWEIYRVRKQNNGQ